jgi:hypothetical protein
VTISTLIPHSTHAILLVAVLVVSCDRRPQPGDTATPAAKPASTSAVGTAGAANPAENAAPTPTPADPANPQRDADAIAALERMGAYLRGLKSFQVRSETSRDEVLTDGQNVEFDGVTDIIVERPNRIRAEVTNDKQQRMYFGDGKTFSVWAQRVNYYATIPSPPTLAELADTLADKYDLELPLADLFYWGDKKNTDDIRGAMDIGPSQVDGVTCEHYAYRQDGADWQVWMQLGAHPLPRKLVISTTTDAARPKFAAKLTWNLAPSYDDAAFTFTPPRNAKKITLSEAQPSGTP